jgi:signal transduction histidine kinase
MAPEHDDLRLAIVESLPFTIVGIDGTGRIVIVSAPRVTEGVFAFDGPPERIRGLPYSDAFSAEFLEAADIAAHLDRARASRHEVVVPRVVIGPESDERHLRVSIVPVHCASAEWLIHVDDLTDVVRAEARLRLAESVAHLGRMAANVAHEVRNPLASISLTLQMMEGSFAQGDDRRAAIARVGTEVHRLDRLVGDLLAYARPAVPVFRIVDLGTIVHDVARPLGADVEVVGGPVMARVDAGLARDIIRHLLQNARDAAGPSGRVVARVGPGPRVLFADDGPGIDPRHLPVLFDPFFTTKTRGTGLGLAICRKDAEAMGAQVALVSAAEHGVPLEGACFLLSLPPARTSPPSSRGGTGARSG